MKNNNYLDLIPVKNPDYDFTTDENGIVTVNKEWTGFYSKIAQRFFKKPRVSQIKLDKEGSFIWLNIDGERNVHEISKILLEHEPNMEKALSRLIKFLEILHDHKFITWKGENK